MKNKIKLLVFIFGIACLQQAGFAVFAIECTANERDTVYKTLTTGTYDTINTESVYNSQYKNVRVHNYSGGVIYVAFKNKAGSRDTNGVTPILNNNMQDFPNEIGNKLFVLGTVAGQIRVEITYNPQVMPYPLPYSSTGEVIIKNPYSFARYDYGFRDTVGTDPDTLTRRIDTSGGISRTSLTQFSCTQYWGCWIASDDTIIVSTDIAFPANKLHYIYSSESETRFLFDVNYVSQLYWKSTVTGTATVRMGLWFY